MTLNKYYPRDDLYVHYRSGSSLLASRDSVILHFICRDSRMTGGYPRMLDAMYDLRAELENRRMRTSTHRVFASSAFDWRSRTSRCVATVISREHFREQHNTAQISRALRQLRTELHNRGLSHIAVQADDQSALDYMPWPAVWECIDRAFTGSRCTIDVYRARRQ